VHPSQGIPSPILYILVTEQSEALSLYIEEPSHSNSQGYQSKHSKREKKEKHLVASVSVREWQKKDKWLPATPLMSGKSNSRREKGLRSWYLTI
jgi:hypothetical protein